MAITLTDDQLNKMVAFVMEKAELYLHDNLKEGGRLVANASFFTDLGFPEINPYNTEVTQEAIKNTLKKVFEGKDAAQNPSKLFLAGALGSYNSLKPRYESDSVASDFATYKAGLKDVKITEGLVYNGEGAEYYKIRALCSGLDQAVQEHATQLGFNLVVDNTLAFTDAERPKLIAGEVEHLKGDNVKIVAMALTPDEAAALNKDNEVEARRTAVDFAKSFKPLYEQVGNITILNSAGTVIFKQEKGKVQSMDEKALAEWKKSCGVVIEGVNPTNLPKPGAGQSLRTP